MTPTEYPQLVEFLGPRFDEIYRRFERLEQRLAL